MEQFLTHCMEKHIKKSSKFAWNPAHAVGTCADCGEEMVYNVPRLGRNGGFVHKNTHALLCKNWHPASLNDANDNAKSVKSIIDVKYEAAILGLASDL